MKDIHQVKAALTDIWADYQKVKAQRNMAVGVLKKIRSEASQYADGAEDATPAAKAMTLLEAWAGGAVDSIEERP